MKLYGIVILSDEKIIDWTITKYKATIELTEFEVFEHNVLNDDNLTVKSIEGDEYTEFQLWFSQWKIHEDFEGEKPYIRNSYRLDNSNNKGDLN